MARACWRWSNPAMPRPWRGAMQAAMVEPERWRFAASRPPRWTQTAVVKAHLAIYDQALSSRASRTAAERDQL